MTVLDRGRQITRLQEQLTDTYSSRGWKLLRSLRKSQSWLVPPEGGRGEFIRWILRPARRAVERISSSFTARRQHRQLVKARTMLAEILSTHGDVQDIYIFPATLSWEVPLFQRPHQLALALARAGNLVFFCEPETGGSFPPGFTKIQERLYVIARIDLDIFNRIASPVVFTLAYNVNDLSCFNRPRIIYEYIDELRVFSGRQEELFQAHNRMLLEADVVTATADVLYRRVKPFREDAVLCPNGVDYDFITTTISATGAPPEDIRELVENRNPIIGYYGALADWVDYGLIEHVARSCPGFNILLIGPDYSDSVRFKQILEISNISWLGVKPYRQIPGYLKYFDVATIPFVLDQTTHSTSPLKLFEYMSAGKPVVTTAMQECKKYDPVLIARDRNDFVEKLETALELRSDSGYTSRIIQIAQSNTWDQRARTLTNAVQALCGDQNSEDLQSEADAHVDH